MVKIIAEIGSVHDGSFGNALRLIDLTADLGADTVKFQMHIAEAESVRNAPAPSHFNAEPRFEYFKRTGFSPDQWRKMREHAGERGLEFMVSPFSLEAVGILEEVGVGTYKIASGEVTNIPLLQGIAKTGRPVILSSGMSNWAELDAAVAVLKKGTGQLTVLQCTSAYPCPPERTGLNLIPEMAARYGVPIGLSDHTAGIAVPIAAAALGAAAVEKHLTFSRAMYGSDAAYAVEPGEFEAMVKGIREVEAALAGVVDKDDVSPYAEMKFIYQKSLVAGRDLPAGHVLGEADIAAKKPASGLEPRHLDALIGKRLRQAVTADQPLTWDDVE